MAPFPTGSGAGKRPGGFSPVPTGPPHAAAASKPGGAGPAPVSPRTAEPGAPAAAPERETGRSGAVGGAGGRGGRGGCLGAGGDLVDDDDVGALVLHRLPHPLVLQVQHLPRTPSAASAAPDGH